MLFKHAKKITKNIVKKSDIARGYAKHPSLADFLPWCDYNQKHKVFLLEDQLTLATVFNLRPIACEARPEAMMREIARSLKEALQNAIPCEKNDPWTLQLFAVRHRSLTKPMQLMREAIPPARLNEPLVQAHLATMQAHLDYVSRPEGIFVDHQVTQQVFRGGYWHCYAVLYRRQNDIKEKNPRYSALEQIKRISRKLADQWRQCGLGVKRVTAEEFYH